MADVHPALPVAILPDVVQQPQPAASVMASPNAVIVLEPTQDIAGTPPLVVLAGEEATATAERPQAPPAEAENAHSVAPPVQDADDSDPIPPTEGAQTPFDAEGAATANEPTDVTVGAPTAPEPALVVEDALEAQPEETPQAAEAIPVEATPQDAEGVEEPAEPVVIQNFEVDVVESFPFNEEDSIDLGTAYEGHYVVHGPIPDIMFPFNGLEDDDLPQVVKGNFAAFFQLKCGQEFYRNYVRGNSIRRLRTAPNAIKGKPSVLNGFFQLPLEVLYDVLELAHPMDLLHLSRSSKVLRAIVLNKKAEHVWKNAYDSHDDVPSPPSEISPPKWTAMVYDDAICDFCNQPGALLDFALQEHYCETCQRKYLVEQNDMVSVTDSYPRIVPMLYRLLVATYRQSGGKYQTYYESFNNARYRRKDVEAMIETLQSWYMTIDEGLLPEAGDKFEEWSQALINKCSAINEFSQMYNNWATSFYYTLCSELSTKQRAIADQCMKKFSKLGYDERDTDAASSDVYYYFRGAEVWRLTPRMMEKHKPEMISKIETHKKERLKRERREFVDKFYKEYRMTLKPEKWEHLPPPDVVAYDNIFLQFINQESLENVEELKVDLATPRLPELIDGWLFKRQKELYEVLPGVTLPEVEAFVPPPEEEGVTPEEVEKREAEFQAKQDKELKVLMDERMQRATAIFSCTSCKNGRHTGLAVVGWNTACTHMCGSYPHFFHSSWEFCSVGYATAASLVRQLGLDSDVATTEEVDAVNARFFCGNCPVKTHKKIQGRKAYTWRECVTHAVEKEEDHTHAIPAWLLLSKEATSFVHAHEIPHPSPRRTNWSCNHCAEHIDGGVLFKAAQTHVKETHAIEKPVTGVDLIFLKGRYERCHNSRRRPVFHYGIEPTCNLRCNVCRAGRVQRMWTIQALVPHLFHMHGISMPQSVRDYSKIEVLSTT